MLKYLSVKILTLAGWKLNIVLPKERKFVLIGAPHTSNWDFPLALLSFWTLDLKVCWVAKKQMFWGPLYYLFSYLGGIPVDRTSPQGYIQQIATKIEQADEIVLTIAPEGTRSKTDYWKSGFYHIAVSAKVPICLAYIDYSKRTLGFEQVLYPGGDIDEDMKIIADFYKDIKGKRPQCQGPVRLRKY
jgi:1-acyl-sn-glycerol-3-phosphate acyltransferase